jgi:broad specificity phosphatase PhoE
MSALKIYIVRHAPVVGKKGTIYGDEADIDLDGQKERLRELASLLPSPDEAIWHHSGVDRAYRSAKAVLSIMGHDNSGLETNTGFREQDFGDLLGCKHEDIIEHLNFIDGKIYAPAPPNGESIENLIARVGVALSSIRKEALDKEKNNIVVFCHGGTIRAANAAINTLPKDQFITLDTPPLFVFESDIYNYGT